MYDVIQQIHGQQRQALREAFDNARPFRHVLIKDFLTPEFLTNILADFPTPAPEDMVSEFGDPSLKHTVEKITDLGHAYQRWDQVLQSPDFIGFIQDVTGIDDLLFDPDYIGAGTHNNLHGQSLDVHVDFNHHPLTGHHRRLNLIVYLCPEWQDSWGGCIELHKDAWDRGPNREWVSYPPLVNHAVLFETGEETWHGFKQIQLPPDKQQLSRKSLTVYYYTAERQGEVTEEHSTVYVPDWIPESVKPGEMLTEEAYRELETLMYRRDHHLRKLYEREQGFQQQIAKLVKLHRFVQRLMPWRYRRR